MNRENLRQHLRQMRRCEMIYKVNSKVEVAENLEDSAPTSIGQERGFEHIVFCFPKILEPGSAEHSAELRQKPESRMTLLGPKFSRPTPWDRTRGRRMIPPPAPCHGGRDRTGHGTLVFARHRARMSIVGLRTQHAQSPMFMRVNSTFTRHREDDLIGFNSRRLHHILRLFCATL